MDQIQNFIKEAVNGLFDDNDIVINVVDASKFPDPVSGEYNLVWWDITNYPDPSDDPNVEIVRVTDRDTGANTVTVTRAQESTTATIKNTSGTTYFMALCPTKKTIDELATAFQIHNATAKTTPVDADELGLWDSVALTIKKLTWENLKATLLVWLRTAPIFPINAPTGFLINGKIVVTVTSNNLTLALKGADGNDPSASNPVYCKIGGVIRSVTSALSVTKNAATNWCNAGGNELKTQEIDYFAYLGYNATDGVVLGFSRIPFACQYSEFSTTTTNEKYCAISTITNAAATDYYNVIGRFAATLSAGAGYTWSVPTFTAINLIQKPIWETRWLVFAGQAVSDPAGMTLSSLVVNVSRYKVVLDKVIFEYSATATTGGTAAATVAILLPFGTASAGNGFNGYVGDPGGTCAYSLTNYGSIANKLGIRRFDSLVFGLGAGRSFNVNGTYPLL